MAEIQLASSAAEIDATVAASGGIISSTANIEDLVVEIVRYWHIRDDIQVFRGFALGPVTVSSTQIRPLLQRRYFVKLTAQCIDMATKKIFYATKSIAATQNIELDQTIPPGVFDKSNGNATSGDITFNIINGGVVITPTGNVILTNITAS